MQIEVIDIIVKALVGIGTTLITGFLIPTLIRLGSKAKDTRIFNFIKKTVNAAEQLYGPNTGKIKKEYVTEIVKRAFGKVLTDEQIDALIESAVFHISQELKQSKTSHTEENVAKKVQEQPKIRLG